MSETDESNTPAMAPNLTWLRENAGSTVQLNYPDAIYEVSIEQA